MEKTREEFIYPKTKTWTCINSRTGFFFFLIKEKGNPNEHEFTEKIGVLYSLAYAVRMMPKQGYTPAGYFEYTVYPLEGIWDLTERVRN